jgi:hypothetical protein
VVLALKGLRALQREFTLARISSSVRTLSALMTFGAGGGAFVTTSPCRYSSMR